MTCFTIKNVSQQMINKTNKKLFKKQNKKYNMSSGNRY